MSGQNRFPRCPFPLDSERKVICHQKKDINVDNLWVFFFRSKCFSIEVCLFRRQHLMAQPHGKSFDVANDLTMQAMKLLNNFNSHSSARSTMASTDQSQIQVNQASAKTSSSTTFVRILSEVVFEDSPFDVLVILHLHFNWVISKT